MNTLSTHGGRLLAGSVLVGVAMTVLGGLLWGTWRLLSWAAVTGTHHPYGYAAGAHRESMGGYTLGVDVVATRGDVLVAGVSLFAVTLALLALVFVLSVALVRVGDYADDPVTALERASVRGAIDDEECVHQRRLLTGETSDDDSHTQPRR